MPDSHGSGRRRGAISAAAAAVVLLLVGAVVAVQGLRGGAEPAPTIATPDSPSAAAPSDPAEPAASPAPAPEGPAAPDRRPDFGRALPGSTPVGLAIPSIGVRAGKIVGLGLARDGAIEVPKDPADPGWFTPGPSPGQVGPAVIAGHVDGRDGPGVFYRLGEMRRGERIHVSRADGSKATFTVRKVETYDKDEFPTRAVYGATSRADLRLITCSGTYDPESGYTANTVVYASLL